MPSKVLCPDCGGVLGDPEAGDSPCTCFTPPPEKTSKSDTDAFDPITGGEKLCVICGKDVVGHRRLKDSRGYICLPCAKAEKAAEKAGKVRCKFCRKLVKPDGLVPFQGKMICRRCFSDFEEKAKFSKKISTKQYEKHEKRNLIVLACVFGTLVMVLLVNILSKKLGGH